jgi:hypothetical protein
VVVAVEPATEGRGFAFGSARHDVAAFGVHGGSLLTLPPRTLGGSSFFSSSYGRISGLKSSIDAT